MLRKDLAVLEHIMEYCVKIKEQQERFGNSLEAFQNDESYRLAACMCILQIGELSSKLSEDVKKSISGIPWTQVKAMRNVFAHNYGSINIAQTWETIKSDIPILYKECAAAVKTNYEYSKVTQLQAEALQKAGIAFEAKSKDEHIYIKYHIDDAMKVKEVLSPPSTKQKR